MKKITTLILLLSLCTGYYPVTSKFIDNNGKPIIDIQFKKNFEFLGFVYHLGWLGPELENTDETMEFNSKTIPVKEYRSYGLQVYKDHKHLAHNPHLKKIIEIGYHLDFTPVVDLLLRVEDFPDAALNADIDDEIIAGFSESGDLAQGKKTAQAFLDELNQFYVEAGFDAYLQHSQKYYKAARKQLKTTFIGGDFMRAMETFYQKRYKNYYLVPSLLLPAGMAFGPHTGTGTDTEVYNIFGPVSPQYFNRAPADMGFGFHQRLLETSIHEFGHSFAGSAVDEMPDSLVRQTEFLFEKIRQPMTAQGYPEWRICLEEHFVRAGEVLILRSMGLEQEATNLNGWYVNGRRFIYLPIILEELKKYQQGEYASYNDATLAVLMMLASR